MPKRIKLLLFATVTLSSPPGICDMYKCPGPEGTPIFTDKPCQDGQHNKNGRWLSVEEEAKFERERHELERQKALERAREEAAARASRPPTTQSSSGSPTFSHTAGQVPSTAIEPDAMLTQASKEQAYALAILVRLNGFRCDTISAASPFLFSRGFNLKCNHFLYSFELADKGGRWVVTVD